MRETRRTIITLVLPGLLAGALTAGCGKQSAPSPGTPDQETPASTAVGLPGSAVAAGDVAVEPAELRSVADTVVVTGEIQASPLTTAHVSIRVSGTIQSITAVAGARVTKGQVLATLYSPEFLAAQGDYLLAHERIENARAAASPDTSALSEIEHSAQHRLELMGAAASDIERLHGGHQPVAELPLRSPISGVLTEADAATGRQVTAGTDLFGVSDLSSVWAVVDAYERDLGKLRVGQVALVVANAFPERVFPGRVGSLEGAMKEATRTLPVRIEVPNSALELKPGMFVSARVVTGEVRKALVVSEAAVQNLGGRPVVFVATTDTTFVPRPVVVRGTGGNLVEVLQGLNPGERIVVRGAFIVKSQASKAELSEE